MNCNNFDVMCKIYENVINFSCATRTRWLIEYINEKNEKVVAIESQKTYPHFTVDR